MPLQYRAAVLRAPQTPLSIETLTGTALKPFDVLVRIRVTGLCHTDLEVIEGALRYPMPVVLGYEAAGDRRPWRLRRAEARRDHSQRRDVRLMLLRRKSSSQ
jgi:hypothetical protein